ncbi:hypothetical protein F8237_21440 [Bradyrhizobium betae]|jgi:hypothetical protein|uniref:Uncharacterized protein n=1 Tax=Bradyrhizobium betae TaxID=244734 RepID=A0A5P6P909_9BRAD|nr:hypothetical protein F8237_21440 [Bradyrhizobium betae]
MADRKAATRGRKPPAGERRQFLTSINREVVRRIKSAAALRDITASLLTGQISRGWLDRHQDGKKA